MPSIFLMIVFACFLSAFLDASGSWYYFLAPIAGGSTSIIGAFLA